VFDPRKYHGIAVLRLPPKARFADILSAGRTLVDHLRKADPNGKLWVVQVGRLREYQQEH
jgi:hypothetical protein